MSHHPSTTMLDTSDETLAAMSFPQLEALYLQLEELNVPLREVRYELRQENPAMQSLVQATIDAAGTAQKAIATHQFNIRNFAEIVHKKTRDGRTDTPFVDIDSDAGQAHLKGYAQYILKSINDKPASMGIIDLMHNANPKPTSTLLTTMLNMADEIAISDEARNALRAYAISVLHVTPEQATDGKWELKPAIENTEIKNGGTLEGTVKQSAGKQPNV